MPLHRIYHPISAFSAADKAGLAEAITNLYISRGLPAFYVVVLYIPFENDSFYVGGKPTNNFIRIVSQHLARQFPDDAAKNAFMERFDTILAPFIKDKGVDWEVNDIDFSFVKLFLFSRFMSKKFLEKPGEKTDLFHLEKALMRKTNGCD